MKKPIIRGGLKALKKAPLYLICMIFMKCGTSKIINNPNLSGPWEVTISTKDIGRIETVMSFDIDDSVHRGEYSFDAYSPKNADKMVFGFWKSKMARMFSHNFKNGSILYIEDGRFLHNDSISGILNTPFGSFNLAAKLSDRSFATDLKDKNGKVIGRLTGKKGLPKLPLRNYKALWQSIATITKNKLYDPSLLQDSGWKEFDKKMENLSSHADDDAAFILAFFYYSRKKLPFSHYALLRPDSNSALAAKGSKNPQQFVQVKTLSPHKVYMRIASFSGSSEEMDSAFNQVTGKGYDTLIVDLRGNPGGSIEAGMAFVRHLIPDTVTGGVFLTRKYFTKHSSAPAVSAYSAFPVFSESNYHLLLKGISDYEGILLMAKPKPPVFKGKMYVLTDSRTASTCEPIVYMLKKNKIATIVGEKTAGAMLNGERFTLSDGFVLTVPTATYYTSDGQKIDKNGVTPNITVKADSALKIVYHTNVRKI